MGVIPQRLLGHCVTPPTPPIPSAAAFSSGGYFAAGAAPHAGCSIRFAPPGSSRSGRPAWQTVAAMSSSVGPGSVHKSEDECRAILSPEQFRVLRLKASDCELATLSSYSLAVANVTPSILFTTNTKKGRWFGVCANGDGIDAPTAQEDLATESSNASATSLPKTPSLAPDIDKELKKAVLKTAATFAPRASTASKNPAVPGTALYTIFEVQGYMSMLIGGALSFNLLFPSTEPDIWRLMGMWSIWMFTVPSLRARDCSNKEKEALNYLFLLIPLINVIIPFFVKSFAVVWSADTVAFLAMYAWKMDWFQRSE